jgi:rod shape-determining protein MreC
MERDRAARYDRMSHIRELAERAPFESVVGEVIGWDASVWFHSVTVNRGLRDGIEPNAPVIGPGGLIGRVIAVGTSASQVQLLSDRLSAVAVLLARSRARGIASGAGDLLQLKYVSNLEDVEAGDLVVTSGIDGIYPKGLAVGRVLSVVNGSGLFKEATLSPGADLERLEEVLILRAVKPELGLSPDVE